MGFFFEETKDVTHNGSKAAWRETKRGARYADKKLQKHSSTWRWLNEPAFGGSKQKKPKKCGEFRWFG